MSRFGGGDNTDYLCGVARAHRFWRGSISYYIHFVVDGFTKGRVKIVLTFQESVPSNDNGDLYSRIVEINGPTIVSFCVPFLRNRYWENTTEFFADHTPWVSFELLDTIATSGSTPTIDVLVFRAGGRDVQFSGLQTSNFARTPPVMQTQSHVRSSFQQPFDSLIEGCSIGIERGFCTDETSQSISSLMKRYGEAIDVQSEGPDLGFSTLWPSRAFVLDAEGVLFEDNDAPGMSTPFYYFMSFFLFWRGDIRYRFRNNTTLRQVSNNSLDAGFNIANGAAYTYGELNPDLAVEIPYSATVPYLFIQDFVQEGALTTADLVSPAMAGTLGGEILAAAGDNFICGHVMPPPRFLVPAPPTLVRTATTTNSVLETVKIRKE